MEGLFTDEYLKDIETYVTDFLKAKSVARMKADIKKCLIENQYEEPKAQRFLDWKAMKDKIKEQSSTIDNLKQIIKDMNNGNDIATKYSKLNSDYLRLERNYEVRQRDVNRYRKLYKDSLKQTNKESNERAMVKRAKAQVKKYEEISERLSDIRKENRELRFELEKANKRNQDLNKAWEEKESMYDEDGNYMFSTV